MQQQARKHTWSQHEHPLAELHGNTARSDDAVSLLGTAVAEIRHDSNVSYDGAVVSALVDHLHVTIQVRPQDMLSSIRYHCMQLLVFVYFCTPIRSMGHCASRLSLCAVPSGLECAAHCRISYPAIMQKSLFVVLHWSQ